MFPCLDELTSADVPLKDKLTFYAAIKLSHGANIDEKQSRGRLKEKILNLIGSPLTRCDGLLLLEAVLQQSTPFYFDRWQDVIIANLKSSNAACQEISLRILKLVLIYSKTVEYYNNIELLLPAVIELLVATSNSNCLAAIECLCMCIRFYPNTIPKLAVESFLVKQLDTNSSQICEATADCFSALPRCSDSNNSTKIVLTKAYSITLKKFLYSLQDILNKLLNKDEVYQIDQEDQLEQFLLLEMPNTNFSKIMTLARIFSSYSVCVAKFLCLENAVFEVPVVWILQFIDRVFYLSEFLKDSTSDGYREPLQSVYPLILKGAFTILESLIQNFGLVHQMDNLLWLLKKAIEASYVANNGASNCLMRYLTWKILSILLQKHAAQISLKAGITNFLLQELHKDITPKNPDEAPTATKRQHQMPQRNKKNLISSLEINDGIDLTQSRISTCEEALKALKEFANMASVFQEVALKNDMASCIFDVCYSIQKLKIYPFPYMEENIRLHLYEVIVALITSDLDKTVLQQASAVLNIANKDKSYKINWLVQRADSLFQCLLHPRKKFPEAVTNRRPVQEPGVEEDICSGWENVVSWNMSHSEQQNHNTDHHMEISDVHHEMTENNASLSSEAHHIPIVRNEIPNRFPSETDYSLSKIDRTHTATHSDSENDIILDQDVIENNSSKTYVNADHANNVGKSGNLPETEASSDEDNSDDEELEDSRVEEEEHDDSRVEEEEHEDSRVEEEELEDSRVEEEEEEEEEEEDEEGEEDLNPNKAANCPKQNGLCSNSEDEEAVASATKSENGEYSSENGSFMEEETSKESNHLKRDIETLEEDKKPSKKQKLDDDDVEEKQLAKSVKINNDEADERCNEEVRVGDVLQLNEDSVEGAGTDETNNSSGAQKVIVNEELNCSGEEIIENSCQQEEEVSRSPSPNRSPKSNRSQSPDRSPHLSFNEMCGDLVILETTELASS